MATRGNPRPQKIKVLQAVTEPRTFLLQQLARMTTENLVGTG